MRFVILLICGTHSHYCINSVRGEIMAHKTSKSPPLFVGFFVVELNQESEPSCICGIFDFIILHLVSVAMVVFTLILRMYFNMPYLSTCFVCICIFITLIYKSVSFLKFCNCFNIILFYFVTSLTRKPFIFFRIHIFE